MAHFVYDGQAQEIHTFDRSYPVDYMDHIKRKCKNNKETIIFIGNVRLSHNE